MKLRKLFWFVFTVTIIFIFSFWFFAYFKTENKPIYVPLFATLDFNNNWFLLFPIFINFWLLTKLLVKKNPNLIIVFILGFALIVLINSLKKNITITDSLNDGNDYYQDSLEIKNVQKFLSSFDNRIFFHRLHTRTHPPGPVLFHFILNKLASLVFSFSNKIYPQKIIFNSLSMIFLSTSILFVTYKIAAFFKNPNKNILLLLLFSSPGFLLYSATSMDAIFCLLITLSICYLLMLTKNISFKKIVLASIVSFLASFFTYASIILPLFSLFFILFNKFRNKLASLVFSFGNKKFIYSQLLISIIILLIYLVLFLSTGFRPIASFWAARNFNTMLMPDIFMTRKRYLYSISANFIEYIIFLGPAIFTLLILSLVYLIKQKKNEAPRADARGIFSSFCRAKSAKAEDKHSSMTSRPWSSAKEDKLNLIYYLSFLSPLILLNLSGIYKTGQYSGETGRIWLFLTPLIVGGLTIKDKKILEMAAFFSFVQTLIMQLVLNIFW